MQKIGIIASNSTEMAAAVILNEGEEKNVKAEDFAQSLINSKKSPSSWNGQMRTKCPDSKGRVHAILRE